MAEHYPRNSAQHGNTAAARKTRQRKTARYGRVRRRRPIFPCSCPHSIVGAEGLNYRVRDGNGCTPFAIVTGSPAHPGGFLTRRIILQSASIVNSFFADSFHWKTLSRGRIPACVMH